MQLPLPSMYEDLRKTWAVIEDYGRWPYNDGVQFAPLPPRYDTCVCFWTEGQEKGGVFVAFVQGVFPVSTHCLPIRREFFRGAYQQRTCIRWRCCVVLLQVPRGGALPHG
jgi:hypothetical protein